MTIPGDTCRRFVSIALSLPGICPQRLEQDFLIPLERRLMPLESVTTINALAWAGSGRVEVRMEPTSDVAVVLADVEAALRCVEADLPANARLRVELLDDDDCDSERR